MGMCPSGGVIGVSAEGAVSNRARTIIVSLQQAIVQGLAGSMLGVPNRCWLAVVEANHIMLPGMV